MVEKQQIIVVLINIELPYTSIMFKNLMTQLIKKLIGKTNKFYI